MKHDPELIAETSAWLAKADQDLRMASLAADTQPPMYGQAAYHAQQATEKTLKGFLTWHEVVFGKTHNLFALGRACTDIDPQLCDMMIHASRLTDYVWKYRYPGDPADPTEQEARAAIALSKEIVTAIQSRLPSETHP
ncbi:MAG: HEPN domain-containing protein [Planctomycetes bacterium]|nr:HEPN domain-containing protein [Planctomycetota bacterium]